MVRLYFVVRTKAQRRKYQKKYRELDKEISKKYKEMGATGSFSAFRSQLKKNKKSLI
jgi:hypothetical protein